MKKLFYIRDLKDRISGALKIGKRIYTVDAQCDEHLLAIAVLHGAYLRIIEKEESTVFEVDATSEKIIIDKLREFGYEPRKKRSLIKPYKKRYGLFVGAAIFTAIFIVFSQMIWSIDISGNERLTEEEVLALLDSCGVREGMWNRKIDNDKTRILVMNRSHDIAWMSVNVSGMLARVQIAEATLNNDPVVSSQYSNIVASKDGVISDITVESGKPMVSVGDTVKAGELLISGIIEERDGDISLVNAKGSVIARTEQTLEIKKDLQAEKKVQIGETIKKIRINLFGKSINFSLNGGLNDDNCDIITKKGSFTLFGNFELPIDYVFTYQAEIKKLRETISPDAARSLCEKEAYSILLENGAQLIARKLSFVHSEDNVTLRLFAVCEENIGLVMPFTAEP